LLRLVQEAKSRLEVEKGQASKVNTPAPSRNTPGGPGRGKPQQGSVHPAQAGRAEFQDSPLFALDDNDDDPPQAENTDNDDEQSETSSTDDVITRHRLQDMKMKRTYAQETNVHSPLSGLTKRHKTSDTSAQAPHSHTRAVHATSERFNSKRHEIDAGILGRILLTHREVRRMHDRVFSVRLKQGSQIIIVYMTTERASE